MIKVMFLVDNLVGTFQTIHTDTHLDRDKFESKLSLPVSYHENALINSFEMIPHLIYLLARSNNP